LAVFLKRVAVFTAVLAIGVASCSGPPGTTVQDPLPHGTGITTTGTPVTGTGVSGVTSSVTITGSGNVNAIESSTPPTSLPAIQSVVRAGGSATQSVKPQATTPNVALVYLAITASAAATITGFPASSFTFANAPTGSVFLAEFNATANAWQTIGPAGTVSGATVTFGAVTFSPTIALAAGSSAFFAVYTGGVIAGSPTPTPSPSPPASPTAAPPQVGVLANGGFESPTSPVAIGTAPTAGAWTQCSVTSLTAGLTFTGGLKGAVSVGAGYTNATPPPVTASPMPIVGVTPAAIIAAAGAPAPPGTFNPISTQITVPVHGGGFAAQFGEAFNNTNARSYRYNGMCQTVTVGANGGALTGFVFEAGSESSGFVEDLIGTVDSTDKLTSLLYMENIEASATGTDTAYRAIGPVNLTAGTQTLFIGQWSNSSGTATYDSSYWWVDDLNIVNN
jgi:hypothetical protein